MDSVEQKLNIDIEIEAATKQLKGVLADLDIAKKEKIAFESIKERNITLIAEQNEKLTETLNDIAAQKIEWLHEKDREEKEIESKNDAVDAVLARSTELDKQEATINTIKSEVETARNETRANLLAIEQGKTAIEVIKNEAQAKEDSVRVREEELDKKLQSHKEKVVRALNEINN